MSKFKFDYLKIIKKVESSKGSKSMVSLTIGGNDLVLSMDELHLLQKELSEVDRFVDHYALCSLLRKNYPYFNDEFKGELQKILDKKEKEITIHLIADVLKIPYMQAKNRMESLVQKGLASQHLFGEKYSLLIEDISELNEPTICEID